MVISFGRDFGVDEFGDGCSVCLMRWSCGKLYLFLFDFDFCVFVIMVKLKGFFGYLV